MGTQRAPGRRLWGSTFSEAENRREEGMGEEGRLFAARDCFRFNVIKQVSKDEIYAACMARAKYCKCN